MWPPIFHFGLHILGAARNTATWPLLLRLLRRPGEEVADYLGDALTENLTRIAAGLFDGDDASLFDLLLDSDVDEFVREGLIGTAVFLTVDGRIERSRMEAFLRQFWDNPPDAFDIAWAGWIEAIAMLGLDDLVPLVYQAFERDIIDKFAYAARISTEGWPRVPCRATTASGSRTAISPISTTCSAP